MRKMIVALPMTLVAGAVLLSAPADAGRKTVSDCNAERVACSQNCPPEGSALGSKCRRHCGLVQAQCYGSLGRPTKVPGGGSVVVPKQPGGGVAVPTTSGPYHPPHKWTPNSPPIGTYHPRPPFSTTGPAGTWHSGGSPKGGPILLRSGGRR